MITFLSHEQARKVIDNGDFSSNVTRAAEAVILVLTQSWCSQWAELNQALRRIDGHSADLDLAVIVYEYDLSPLSSQFMEFKESTYQNREVPYVRLYKNGRFISDGNAMPLEHYLDILKKA